MNASVNEKGPVLEVRGLAIELPKGSDRRLAVSSASFTVERGEIVCLVGESGSGKSVIAQSVMGLLPKQLPVAAGTILLEGEARTVSEEELNRLPARHVLTIISGARRRWRT